MKASYILFALAVSFTATANPLGGSDTNIYGGAKPKPNDPSRAPDPPPAPTPFPLSTDGQLSDGSIINYLPDDPKYPQHSCWTAPKSRPPPSQPWEGDMCSVCMVQRNGTDGSADYQLWARDIANNAMGNMWATTVSPINVQKPGNPINASMDMGGSPLLLQAEVFTPGFAQVTLVWARAPTDPKDPHIWTDPKAQPKTFDPASSDSSGEFIHAGVATNGAVRYAQCYFRCYH